MSCELCIGDTNWWPFMLRLFSTSNLLCDVNGEISPGAKSKQQEHGFWHDLDLDLGIFENIIPQQMGHSSARSIGSTLQLEILLAMPNAWKSHTVQSTPILTPSSPTISCHIHKLSVSPFFSFLKHYSLPSAPLSTPPPRLFPTWPSFTQVTHFP